MGSGLGGGGARRNAATTPKTISDSPPHTRYWILGAGADMALTGRPGDELTGNAMASRLFVTAARARARAGFFGQPGVVSGLGKNLNGAAHGVMAVTAKLRA